MPTLDAATFLVRYADFNQAPIELVEVVLTEAHQAYAGCVDYPTYLQIVGNHAAHLLASEPSGLSMRLNKTGPDTAYSVNRDALLRAIPTSASVVA